MSWSAVAERMLVDGTEVFGEELRGALADEADAEAEEDAGETARSLLFANLFEESVGGLFADALEGEELFAW